MNVNLVFIHGAGSNSTVWNYQKHYFDYPATFIDLPGHKTPGEGEDTILGYVDYVRSKISSLENPVLVGHSMGGAISLLYALSYPVKACVLAGTGAKLRVLPAVFKKVKETYEEAIDFILEYAIYNKTEKIMEHSKKEMLKTPPDVTYKDFVACDTFDVMDEIQTLDVPTLVICGENDMLTPVKYSQYLKDHIKLSQLVIIGECGHMVMLEKPDEFNTALKQFLDMLQ
ncbi:MAG: alpha/beta hydrolase [Candidatus Methanofastidiosia archaeon]